MLASQTSPPRGGGTYQNRSAHHVDPDDNFDGELSIHELRRTVQQQSDTIEGLHLAAGKYKNRLDIVEKELLEKDSEISSLSVLTQENSMLREEILSLRESLRRLEQSTSRVIDKTTLGQESQAQLGVRVQAYQRHNAYLQGELSEKERSIKMLHERLDLMTEENHTKDRRIAIMLEKLRQHNIDPSSSVASVRIPEETYATMKVKLVSQASTIELLHEKIDSLSDDVSRKQNVMDAMKRENTALRTSVTKLIDQLTGQATMQLDDGEPSVLRNAGGVRFGDNSPVPNAPGGNSILGASSPQTPRSALKKIGGASSPTAASPAAGGGGGGSGATTLNGVPVLDRSAAAKRLEAYRLAKAQQ